MRGNRGSSFDEGLTLIGRAVERRRLHELLDGLEAGHGGLVLLAGEAGIGKSALADSARTDAERRGIRSVVGRAVPLSIGQALRPVLAALAALDEGTRCLGAAIGDADPPPDPGRSMLEATVGDPTSLLLQRTIDRIDAHCAAGPVLIVLEDLHWADPTTLTFVHHVATRTDPRALAIVATTRPAPAGTALHHLLGGLDASTITIAGLGDEEVTELACRAGIAGGTDHLDDRVRAALAEAGGNPLLVLATLEAGGSGASGPIGARVKGLPADVLRLLQPAAVAGPAIRLDLLGALTGRGTLQVMELLEAAVHAGVVVHGDAVHGFRHDLYRTAVLDTLPTDAIEALHLDIARALERMGATRLEIAEHVASGARPGNLDAVAMLTVTAEELAVRDPVTALAISDLAVGLLAGAPMPEPVQVVRIASLATCGRTAEAEVLGEALLANGVSAEVEARVRRDLALAAFVQGRSADAETHMRAAAEMAPDPQHAARARTELAWAQFLSLDRSGALEGAAIGERHGDAFTRVAAGSLLCWLGLWSLDTALATRAAHDVEILVGDGAPGDWQVFQPLLGAAAVHLECGAVDHSITLARRGRRMAAAAGTSWAAPAYDAMLATAAWRCGDLDAAGVLAAAALDGTAIVDGFGVEIWSRALLAELALRRGELDIARDHLQVARLASQDGRVQLGTNHLVVAEAMAADLSGDGAGAFERLRLGWEFLCAVGCDFVRASTGAELVKHGVASGAARDELDAVAAVLDADAATGGLPLLVAEAARARAWLDPTAVMAAVDASAASGCRMQRHDALGDALVLAPSHTDCPAWIAEIHQLRAGAGLPTHAPGGGGPAGPSHARSPRRQRDRPRFGPESLTAAELRVANLVAEGLTNTQIAAALVVSRRTVDTQVLAAYRKLGVSSRVGLTRILLELRSPSDADL
jgi:DNA-binding CsgD family transcriptional regulator